jgi:nitrite reductase/ring-hydroxylating ferredoxin subunit
VVCPLHGYEFDLASGAPVRGACPPLRTYALTIDERGYILLTLEELLPCA